MKRVKESQLLIVYSIVLITVAVYSFYLAYKNWPGKNNEIIIADDLPQLIEITVKDVDSNSANLNSSKFIRSLSHKVLLDKTTLPLELYEIEIGVFSLSIFFKIPWIQQYSNKESNSYKTLSTTVSLSIEDLYDKKFFEMEKSIGINVDSIDALDLEEKFGIVIRMKVFGISGDIVLDELKDVIANGSSKIIETLLNLPQRSKNKELEGSVGKTTNDYDNYGDETTAE